MRKSEILKIVGRSQRRVDGDAKVTGQAVYAGDIELSGMSYGKILRSPFPHAQLIKVDATRASKIPGVLAVITRDDLSCFSRYYGTAYPDQSIVAVDKVRYVGDPVAAVAAEEESVAEEALTLIDVAYRQLPAVTTLEEALAPNAPLVHEAKPSAGKLYAADYQLAKKFSGTNVCYHFNYVKGNVAEGFHRAAHIFEDVFTFPRVQHYSMEPHTTVAHVRDDGITLWASTQDPFMLRHHLAGIFQLPLNKVRVIVPYVGGAYGGKLSIKTEPLAAALSWKARRPVRLCLTVEESFKTITRHPARVRIKTGVSRDGRLMARECEIYMDTGAYADAGPRVTQKAGYRALGPYRIPNTRVDAYTVYTNTSPAGAFRGFGSVQVAWAYESQMDIIAEKLGMDSLEIRLKNLLKKGEAYSPGDTPVDCDLGEGLMRVAKALRWDRRRPKPNTGTGLSCCMKDAGGSYKIASAEVKLAADGSIVLLTGTVELGQGPRTALSQIVAEELSVPVSRVAVAQLDTDTTPYDVTTSSSRSTTVMGLCVQRAARDAKKQLFHAASMMTKEKANRLTLKDGKIYAPNGRGIPYEEVMAKYFGAKWGEIIGKGFYRDKKSKMAALGAKSVFWEVSWGGAAVEVDVETGEIKILKYVSVSDVGKAINPIQCLGQDEGCAIFGIGHTLLEEMVYNDGQLVNPNLIDYTVPRFADVPQKFCSSLVENRNGPGPYGSKGMGEGGLLPVAPAIANAVYNAVGVRIFDLPLTREKVWRAITLKHRAKPAPGAEALGAEGLRALTAPLNRGGRS